MIQITVLEEEQLKTTLEFAPLEESIADQILPLGSKESDIRFPETLTVRETMGEETTERTLSGITWKLDAENSDYSEFQGGLAPEDYFDRFDEDGEPEETEEKTWEGYDKANEEYKGAIYTYIPVIPESEEIPEDTALPEIHVQVGDAGIALYADEGISGTNVKHRDEFQMMIADCEDGNIDLILTKSITRFARNTVECIQTIRKLKEIGVGIYFEKENINTLSEKSELFITILASVAQGESENISSNNRWAIQKRFQDGTYIISTPAYGYGKDEDGNLVIIESEAETVRWIYESYLNGMGVYVIAKALNQKGIPTIRGAEKWQDGVIQDILKNPIYEGDMLQQRTYTETRFPFVRRVNNGQRNQYLIKDSHPPIVTHEEAEAVRNLMAYRVDVLHMNKSDYTKRYLFSGRIICGECGRTFRRQKIYIGKPYEKIIWTCSGHVEDKESCCMKAIREDVLHRAFTDMWNKLYTNQGTILEPLLKELTELVAARQDSEEIRQLDKEIKDISGQSQILNQVMRKGYMDSALFMESSSKLGWQLTECRRKKTLLTRKLRRTKEIVRTEQLIQLIAEQDGLREEFDEQLFKMTAEKIVVSKEHDITFCLYNGLKLTERGGGQDAVAHANRL